MHSESIALKGEKARAFDRGGDVTLDLRPLINRLVDRLRLAHTLKTNADPNTGLILILRSNQLEAVQKSVRVIKVVSIFVVIAVLLLFGLALWLAGLSAQFGRIGGCIFGVGLLLLVLQRLLGGAIIDLLLIDQNKPQLLERDRHAAGNRHRVNRLRPGRDRGSVLAGPSRVGVTVRRWLRPFSVQSVVVVYAVVIAIFLILSPGFPSVQTVERSGRSSSRRCPVGHRAPSPPDTARVPGEAPSRSPARGPCVAPFVALARRIIVAVVAARPRWGVETRGVRRRDAAVVRRAVR